MFECSYRSNEIHCIFKKLLLLQLTNKDRALAVVRRVMDKFHQNSEANDPSEFCLVQLSDKAKG